MPAALTTLTLSDGTTTCNLVDGTNYQLIDGGWAPQDTYLLPGALWRRGPYANVTEEITIDITGADTATLLANRDRLTRLFDQATRWALGQGVSAVLISCLPQGSNGAALSAAVFGRRGGSAVGNPQTWNDLLMVTELPNVPLTFERAGPWLAASDQATASAVANPGLMTATFGSTHPTPSPLKIELTGFTAASLKTGAGFLIVANDANKIVQFNAEAATSGGGTSVADAASFPLGNVLRLTENSGTYFGTTYFPNFLSTIREVAFYATVRNNDTTYPQGLSVITTDTSGAVTGAKCTIPAGGGTPIPNAVYIGTVRLNAALKEFYIGRDNFGVVSAGTLDVDTIVMLGRNGVDDETCRAVPFGVVGPAATSGNWKHVFDPRALTKPTPFVGTEMTSGGAQVAGPWGGDPFLLTTGTTVRAVYLSTYPDLGYWRHAPTGTATSIGFTATRQKAFLTPQ